MSYLSYAILIGIV